MPRQSFILFLILSLATACVWAADTIESGRLYTTKEEQLETGRKHEITEWLTLFGLIELEWESNRYHSRGINKHQSKKGAANIQFGAYLHPMETIQLETVVQFGSDINKWETEEALLAIDLDPWEINLGKQQLPFGKFISHFASGPMIEFGDITEKSLSINIDINDLFDLSNAIFYNDKPGYSSDRHGWVLSLETNDSKPLSAGISYLSNLIYPDKREIANINNQTSNKVQALSSYLLWRTGQYEISLEALTALNSYDTFAQNNNRPSAWNLEFNQLITAKFDYTLRLEGSKELLNEPERKVGIGINYRIDKNTAFSLEFIREKYFDLPVHDNEDSHESINSVFAQLSVAF